MCIYALIYDLQLSRFSIPYGTPIGKRSVRRRIHHRGTEGTEIG